MLGQNNRLFSSFLKSLLSILISIIFINFSKAASADCYSDPVNTIGTSGPCAGMLIVDFSMLQTAVNDSSYTIIGPDGQSYTLADSDKNIFTGQLTSLENLFRFKRFNGDINYWDVSNVTSLRTTFRDNNVFTGNISSWDVSNVTDMRETFRGAVFNGDITSWDVSSVTNMELTFYGARNFNQNISSWNVSNVSKFSRTFHNATLFDQDIRSWSVKSDANFTDMFKSATLMNAAPYNAPETPSAAWFAAPDTTAPTLSGVSISSSNSTSSKAVPDDVVSLTFTASETISSPTVTFSSGGTSVNGTVSVQNTSANTWTASFVAKANDTAGPVTYSIAFRDTAGNAGTAVTSTSDGTAVGMVIDTGAPTLISSTPSDNSSGVNLDQNILLTFSEDVVAGSGDIKLFEGNGNLVETFVVSSAIISGSRVTVNPTLNFKLDTGYYVQISASAFVDTASNNYPGITDQTALNFTTRKANASQAFNEVKDKIDIKNSRIQPNRLVALRLRLPLLYLRLEVGPYQNGRAATVPLEVHQVVLQVAAMAIKLEEPTQASARLRTS